MSAVEHHAILDPAQWLEKAEDAELVVIPVDAEGTISLAALRADLAEREGTDMGAVALAWLLAHPARIMPVVGTNNLDRIAQAHQALSVRMDRQDWFALYQAALGRDVP